VKQKGKSSVESKSLSCINNIVALRIVWGFKFRFWHMQINVRRVITSYLLLKTWQCVLNFETVIFYISFIHDFFFLWRVLCIISVVRQIKTSLDFIQQQTYSEARYIHSSGEKQNSSKIWINLTSYDTLTQTVKHSVTLLTLCVCREILHINEL